MDLPEFPHGGGIEDEGGGMGLAEAFGEFVDEEAEADPAIEIRHEGGAGVAIHFSGEERRIEVGGPKAKVVGFQAKVLGQTETFFQMQKMAEGFRPIFPRMAGGVGGDERV